MSCSYNWSMTIRSTVYLEAIDRLPAGAVLVVPGVRWDEYQELTQDAAIKPGICISYNEGTLEVARPFPEHERYREFISDLARAFAEEAHLPLRNLESTTCKQRRIQKGIDPEVCFYVANANRIEGKERVDLESDPPPDIAVEIDVANESSGKFPIYAALGIPELWCYDTQQLEIYSLKDDAYIQAETSRFLIGLASSVATDFLDISKTQGRAVALRLFRQR